MRLIRQYISSSVLKASAVVLLAVAALDLVTTVVDQADSMRGDYNFLAVLEYTLYLAPKKLVTAVPFAVLIGVLFGLGQLASTSELTVMRAAGISVRRLGWYAMRGALAVIITGMLIAEYIASPLELIAEANRDLKRMPAERVALEASDNGFWGKEGSEFFRVGTVLPSGKLYGIVRFEFDEDRLQRISYSEEAIYVRDEWLLQQTHITHIGDTETTTEVVDEMKWRSEMSPRVMQIVAADEDNLSIRDLYYYANYLEDQSLDASAYKLALWQKVLQPIASISLVFIAISFVFGPLRQVTMGFRIFTGIVAGIAFSTLQYILGPVSLVFGLPAILAVSIPIMICLVIGLYLLRRAK